MRAPQPASLETEKFFQGGRYWEDWSRVPDLTADIPYAFAALEATHRFVLDVGCGPGRLLKAFAGRRPDVRLFGLDVNLDVLRQVRETVPRAWTGVASVYAIPFRERAFDLVLCHQAFMHFEHPRAALAELTRVARSGVYLSVTTRRQLNTLLRRLGLLGTSDVPHWTYNVEDLQSLLPRDEFEWTIVGAFLLGQKALRLSHATHLRVHRLLGRHLPQWLLRRFGQTLFLYGRRRGENGR